MNDKATRADRINNGLDAPLDELPEALEGTTREERLDMLELVDLDIGMTHDRMRMLQLQRAYLLAGRESE